MLEQPLTSFEFRGMHNPPSFSLFYRYIAMKHLMVNDKLDKVSRYVLSVKNRIYPYSICLVTVTSKCPFSHGPSRDLLPQLIDALIFPPKY